LLSRDLQNALEHVSETLAPLASGPTDSDPPSIDDGFSPSAIVAA